MGGGGIGDLRFVSEKWHLRGGCPSLKKGYRVRQSCVDGFVLFFLFLFLAVVNYRRWFTARTMFVADGGRGEAGQGREMSSARERERKRE